MLRALLIGSLLAACAGGSRGPAWPKPSEPVSDGGESLAPRRVSPLAKHDVPSSEDDVSAIKPDTEHAIDKPETDTETETPAPTTTPTTITSPDVIIDIDDIVIDIDDD